MTKTHLIIIAAIGLCLLVIFGHGNPLEKYRKARQQRAAQTLVTKIMKHNDPTFGKKSKHPSERHDEIDDGIDTSADKDNVEIIQAPAAGVRASRRLQPGQGRAGVVGVDGAAGNSYNEYQGQDYQSQNSQGQARPTGGAVETTSGNYYNNYNNTANQASPVQGTDQTYYPPTAGGAQGQGGAYLGTAGTSAYPVHQNYNNPPQNFNYPTNNPNRNNGPTGNGPPRNDDYYPPTQ